MSGADPEGDQWGCSYLAVWAGIMIIFSQTVRNYHVTTTRLPLTNPHSGNPASGSECFRDLQKLPSYVNYTMELSLKTRKYVDE